MHVLLLGAGFSRNWGGWLADEFTGELLGRLSDEPRLCEQLQRDRAFEATLEVVQTNASRSVDGSEERRHLQRLQAAIADVFAEMNQMFASHPRLPNDQMFGGMPSVMSFLTRFDAIFTLNQDLLLELLYGPPRGWNLGRVNGYELPFVSCPDGWVGLPHDRHRVGEPWYVNLDQGRAKDVQPIFKLHGSVNWRMPDGTDALVIGGNKAGTISRHRLLAFYFEEFRQALFRGRTQLMTIGYGFRDDHINKLLIDAATQAEMSMFLVNPAGLAVFEAKEYAAIREVNPLSTIPLRGIATRPFLSAFQGDPLLLGSLWRVFKD